MSELKGTVEKKVSFYENTHRRRMNFLTEQSKSLNRLGETISDSISKLRSFGVNIADPPLTDKENADGSKKTEPDSPLKTMLDAELSINQNIENQIADVLNKVEILKETINNFIG